MKFNERDLHANHPEAMIRRTEDENGFTLIHEDVGEGNVLVPREGDRPIYIIDRQPSDWSLTTLLGVYDLAYAIVLDWEIETRRRLEIPVLRQYHAHLIIYGVRDYSWQQLLNDYRLCVAMGVYSATEHCRGGINKTWRPVWLRMLRRALTACDDLNCCERWLTTLGIPRLLREKGVAERLASGRRRREKRDDRERDGRVSGI